MSRVLLFGASGHAGMAIAKELKKQGYDCSAVVRSEEAAKKLNGIAGMILIRDVNDPGQLKGICEPGDIVISALGKSVSPNDRSRPSFHEIDFIVNRNILQEAINSKAGKFIYLSALHSEQYPQLEYFRAHHEFSELLTSSGMDYSIIKPPALFSAFRDLMSMAEKGRLMTMGKGDKKTNPLAEEDLALICVKAIQQPNSVIEAGGPEILTRHEINTIIQSVVNNSKNVRRIPIGLVKVFLPLIRLIDKNSYDKFSFFTAVMQHDTIAPQAGSIKLEEYVKKVKGEKSNVKQGVSGFDKR